MIVNQENSGTVGLAGGVGVKVGLGLGFEAGKIGVESTSGTSMFAQLGSWIWTVEMSRMATNG
jgi:hypothetical protein